MSKENFDLCTVEQPKNLKVSLFKHQLRNVYRMEQMEISKKVELLDEIKETCMGFLTDETGSGKTLSVIGLLCRDRMQWNPDIPYTLEKIKCVADFKVKSHSFIRYDKIQSNLVLVSASILHQWVNEINKSSLKCLCIQSAKQIEKENMNDYDIVLVTPNFFNKLVSRYKNFAWKRFIFDEPGHLRVPAMKNIIAGFYWFITATPETIYYQHRNCRNTFMESVIDPIKYKLFEEVYEGLIIKNDEHYIRLSFVLPDVNYINHDCYQPLHSVINGLVSSTVDKMLESGNIEGVIHHLGGKRTSNIVELVKNTKQTKIMDLKTKLMDIEPKDPKHDEIQSKINILTEQILTLESRFATLLTGNCSICLKKFSNPVIEPCCHNVFCTKCLIGWLQRSRNCPLCRADIDLKDLVYLQTENVKKTDITTRVYKTKKEVIVELIKSESNKKFLIFCRYEGSFNTIIKILQEFNITYSQMKGNSSKREKIVDDFNNGLTQVIFLNSDHDGAGLNLQSTDHIILYHEMPDFYMKQIIGRANRIGRTKELFVHTLKLNQN